MKIVLSSIFLLLCIACINNELINDISKHTWRVSKVNINNNTLGNLTKIFEENDRVQFLDNRVVLIESTTGTRINGRWSNFFFSNTLGIELPIINYSDEFEITELSDNNLILDAGKYILVKD